MGAGAGDVTLTAPRHWLARPSVGSRPARCRGPHRRGGARQGPGETPPSAPGAAAGPAGPSLCRPATILSPAPAAAAPGEPARLPDTSARSRPAAPGRGAPLARRLRGLPSGPGRRVASVATEIMEFTVKRGGDLSPQLGTRRPGAVTGSGELAPAPRSPEPAVLLPIPHPESTRPR